MPAVAAKYSLLCYGFHGIKSFMRLRPKAHSDQALAVHALLSACPEIIKVCEGACDSNDGPRNEQVLCGLAQWQSL